MSPSSSDILIFPSSSGTVSVKALVAFPRVVVPSELFFAPAPGTVHVTGASAPLVAPGYSFLIEHLPSGRRVVFDLGIRKDRDGASPASRKSVGKYEAIIEHDVAEQLRAGGVELSSVEAIIWSHSHFDHTGDPSTFPHSTALVVGPGTKAAVMPGYPADPDSQHLESDFAGREVREITFAKGPEIGGFAAHDYFGDGSFFLLDTPGHCIGHLVALARVTDAPTPSYVLLLGDAAHHPALLRPSPFKPLPSTRRDSLPDPLKPVGFPSYTHPFILPPAPEKSVHADDAQVALTLAGLQVFDGHDDVLIVLAHDSTLGGVVPTFPQEINKWKELGWKEQVHWAFLEDGSPGNRWSGRDIDKK